MNSFVDKDEINLSIFYNKYKIPNSNDVVFIKKKLKRHISFLNRSKKFSNNRRG